MLVEAGDELAPLSFQQESMLHWMRAVPECAPRYDMVRLFDLSGPLDVTCLTGALHDVIERHPALRTTIATSAAGQMQRVHLAKVADVVLGSGGTPAAFAQALLDGRHDTAAVLAGMPLFRPRIVSIEPRRHLLAITMHHLVCDSLAVFALWRDLSEYYAARIDQRPASLPRLQLSYAEYARRQREGCAACATRELPFWREMTAGAPRQIAWPALHTTTPSYTTAAQSFVLPAAAVAAVRRCARDEGITPFLVLLAATGLALTHVTGQDDLLLGTDFGNREAAVKQDVFGFFINTRLTRIRRRDLFRDLVADVRNGWLAGEEHRDVYINQVLEDLGVPWLTSVHLDMADLLVNPVFRDVIVTPVRANRMDPYWREFHFTWCLDAGEWSGEMIYRPSRISPATIGAVAREIPAILNSLAK